MEMGHRIKQARDAAGWSQTELADAVEGSRGLVGQWENHTKRPGREVLIRLSHKLAVSLAFLAGEESIEQSQIVVSDPVELTLLRRFRAMSPEQRDAVMALITASAKVHKKDKKPKRTARAGRALCVGKRPAYRG